MAAEQRMKVNIPGHAYDIIIGHGVLAQAAQYIDLKRKVLIVTDEGVPAQYAEILQQQCQQAYVARVQQGEGAKSFAVYEALCRQLLEYHFSRQDLVIALGGGVMGDLAGFVAASYMRGIDFVNIPTTTLSQIDSSIGGKVAINLAGVKNIIGAFYQPQMVLIDLDTLSTLSQRHYHNGLVEAVKSGLIYDESLFQLFEQLSLAELEEKIDTVITKSLAVKRSVVEQDEKEQGLRKILNFGHTLGHGIESAYGLQGLLHGEAVALGMLLVLENQTLKQRLQKVLEKLEIPTQMSYDVETVFAAVSHDKKAKGGSVTLVQVPEAGKAVLQEVPLPDLKKLLERGLTTAAEEAGRQQ